MKAPIFYKSGFITGPDAVLKMLADELDWEKRDAPRQEYYCNRYPNPYVYGIGKGQRLYHPKEWHSLIVSIREAVEEEIHCTMDVCFLNRYLNQSHHLGWHADDSPEMDDKCPIAIVSLGVEREIWFRQIIATEICKQCRADLSKHFHKMDCSNRGEQTKKIVKYGEVEKLTLGAGSLCVMQPGMQDAWQHRIPKASFQCGERISLTFRGYVNGQ